MAMALRSSVVVCPAARCRMPPILLPAPALDAVHTVADAAGPRGIIPLAVPAVAVAAVPFCDWLTLHATEQYTTAETNRTCLAFVAGCWIVRAVAAPASTTSPVVAE